MYSASWFFLHKQITLSWVCPHWIVSTTVGLVNSAISSWVCNTYEYFSCCKFHFFYTYNIDVWYVSSRHHFQKQCFTCVTFMAIMASADFNICDQKSLFFVSLKTFKITWSNLIVRVTSNCIIRVLKDFCFFLHVIIQHGNTNLPHLYSLSTRGLNVFFLTGIAQTKATDCMVCRQLWS